MNCITFTSNKPKILTVQFTYYEIHEFFIKNKSHQMTEKFTDGT